MPLFLKREGVEGETPLAAGVDEVGGDEQLAHSQHRWDTEQGLPSVSVAKQRHVVQLRLGVEGKGGEEAIVGALLGHGFKRFAASLGALRLGQRAAQPVAPARRRGEIFRQRPDPFRCGAPVLVLHHRQGDAFNGVRGEIVGRRLVWNGALFGGSGDQLFTDVAAVGVGKVVRAPRFFPQGQRPVGVVSCVAQQAVAECSATTLGVRKAIQRAHDARARMGVVVELSRRGVALVEEAQQVARQGSFVGLDGQRQPCPDGVLVEPPGGDPRLEQRIARLRHGLCGDPQVADEIQSSFAFAGSIEGADVVAARRGVVARFVVGEIGVPIAAPHLGAEPLPVEARADGRGEELFAQRLRLLAAHRSQAALGGVVVEIGAQRVVLELGRLAAVFAGAPGAQRLHRAPVGDALVVEGELFGAGGGLRRQNGQQRNGQRGNCEAEFCWPADSARCRHLGRWLFVVCGDVAPDANGQHVTACAMQNAVRR